MEKPKQSIKTQKRLFICLLICLITATAAYTCLSARSNTPKEPLPSGIVDMHCHVAGIGAGNSGCFISDELRNNWRFGIYLRAFGVTKSELKRFGDALIGERIAGSLAKSRHVRKAVILAMDGVMDPKGQLDTNRTEIYIPNEFVASMCSHHSNLLFGASVNPYRSDAIERLDWVKAHHAVLLKWLPPIMKISPDDPKLVPFYKRMVELDLPLLTHTGSENSFSKAIEEYGDPEKLRLPLSLGVTVIASHTAAGGTYHGERGQARLARLMREFPNLYADVSALTQINRPGTLKEALTRPEFKGRLLYGTDFPLINTALVSPWYSLKISLADKCRISKCSSPWDRDILTKAALGVPSSTYSNTLTVLKLWPN